MSDAYGDDMVEEQFAPHDSDLDEVGGEIVVDPNINLGEGPHFGSDKPKKAKEKTRAKRKIKPKLPQKSKPAPEKPPARATMNKSSPSVPKSRPRVPEVTDGYRYVDSDTYSLVPVGDDPFSITMESIKEVLNKIGMNDLSITQQNCIKLNSRIINPADFYESWGTENISHAGMMKLFYALGGTIEKLEPVSQSKWGYVIPAYKEGGREYAPSGVCYRMHYICVAKLFNIEFPKSGAIDILSEGQGPAAHDRKHSRLIIENGYFTFERPPRSSLSEEEQNRNDRFEKRIVKRLAKLANLTATNAEDRAVRAALNEFGINCTGGEPSDSTFHD
jgi:hypothetical protein